MAISSKLENEASEYTQSLHAEKAILLEEIIIEQLSDKIGKFSIPILTPTNSNYSKPVDKNKSSISSKKITSDVPITTSSYSQSNYIKLKIPKYIVSNFSLKIPEHTEFIVIFLGSGYELDDIKIIGVC